MNYENLLKKINTGLDTGDKSLGLFQRVFGIYLPKDEEARQAYITKLKTDDDIGADELIDLVLDSGTRVREAKNKRKILKKAMKNADAITSHPEYTEPSSYCDDDWLAYFFDRSKNVSNEVVQEVWARVLVSGVTGIEAGYKKMVDVLSLLDEQTASTFSNLCRITFDAPGIVKDNRSQAKVPFVLASTTLYNMAWRFNLADLNDVDHMKYIELASEQSNLPFHEYCDIVPGYSDLVLLEELGLIKINYEAPNKAIFRKIACTERLDPKGICTSNQYICGNESYYISCPKRDYRDWGDGSGVEVGHSVGVGFIEYTTIGNQLFAMIHEEMLPSLPNILKLYYEYNGYTVQTLDDAKKEIQAQRPSSC